MHAADGTFFTSTFAFVVAHLLLKSHLETTIGCSRKMKTACLAGAESRDLFAHLLLDTLAIGNNITMRAIIIWTSAVAN